MNKRIASTEYGPGTPCNECGTEIDMYSPEWTEYCFEHAEQRSNPFVLELEELVEEWEEFAEPHGWDGYSNGVREATAACAEALEEVIEEHTE